MMKIYSNLSPFVDGILSGEIDDFSKISDVLLDNGFDGIEINQVYFDIYHQGILSTGFDIESIDFSGEKLGISIHSNYFDFNLASINPFSREAAIEQVAKEYNFASEKNIKMLTIHPGRVRKVSRETACKLLIDSLGRVFERLPESDLTLSIENMDGKRDKLLNQVEEIGSLLSAFPGLGLTVDFAHLGLNGEDIDSFLGKFSERIVHVHLSGVKRGKRHGDVALDKSEIDFSRYLSGFIERDVAVVIENRKWEDLISSKRFLVARIKKL